MYVQVRLQTFAIRAAEMVQGRPISAAQVPDNHAWIDFAGPPGTYRTYSMAKVLDGGVPSSAFAGKSSSWASPRRSPRTCSSRPPRRSQWRAWRCRRTRSKRRSVDSRSGRRTYS